MLNYVYPLAIIVLSNVVYQICAKGIPPSMNVYASMTITYAVATIFSAILFFVTTKGSDFHTEFARINWAVIVLGIVITGLEIGFIFAYKVGWSVSTLSIVANAFLAVALIFVGFFCYHEPIHLTKIVGVLICLVGMWFISRK